jgi:hypothetical protein
MSSPLQSLLDQLVLTHLKNNQRGASDKRHKLLVQIAIPCIMNTLTMTNAWSAFTLKVLI